jgi:hypothetical protein
MPNEIIAEVGTGTDSGALGGRGEHGCILAFVVA